MQRQHIVDVMDDRLLFNSPSLDTEYHVFFSRTAGAELPRLVLVLDGDDQFSAATVAAKQLQAAGLVPALLLVGLGYGGSYRSPKNRRARDYTQTASSDEPTETGGASKFHTFLETELLPWLKTKYDFVEGDFTITGHSLGGLFAAYAALQPNPLFRRFLASSPSVWWDNRSLLAETTREIHTPSKRDLRLFLSVGLEDSESMVGDLTLLDEALKGAPRGDLHYTIETFPKKDHFNVLPTAFDAGFRWLFAR